MSQKLYTDGALALAKPPITAAPAMSLRFKKEGVKYTVTVTAVGSGKEWPVLIPDVHHHRRYDGA